MADSYSSSGLHHAIVAPGPPSAEGKFLHAAGGGIGVVQNLWVEDDAEFAQQTLQRRAAISQAWKFNAVPIDVEDDGLFAGDDKLPQSAQAGGFFAKELDQRARFFQSAGVDDHCERF